MGGWHVALQDLLKVASPARPPPTPARWAGEKTNLGLSKKKRQPLRELREI